MDVGPEALVHGSRLARQIGKVTVDQGELPRGFIS